MKKVLIADDTKNIRTLLATYLEMEGYDIQVATDGQMALEIFKTQEIDLAFLDIKMPVLSGTEVLRQIRKSGINTPVIIMTAFATVKNAIECTKLGAVSYLQKPFTAEKIRTVLNEINGAAETSRQSGVENYIMQAEIAIDHNEYNHAVDLLKKAISIEPANSRIYLLFGKAYEGIGDIEVSKKFYSAYKLFE